MLVEGYQPLVEVTRGKMVESIHFGAFCVVDHNGRLLAHAGSPDLVSYPRSSLKPLQVLPLIEEGGAETFGLTGEEIAIMCGSHAGTLQHVAVLESLHEKIGVTGADLACGVHWPYDTETREAMKLAGEEPTVFNHNCSGKHSGMLAYARLRGFSTQNYLDPSHPVQVAIRKAVGEMVSVAPDQMPMGIDGCSAPVYGMPMRNMAQAVAKLADPAGLGGLREEACRTVTSAMIEHPFMVAGPHQFDTDLMSAAGGKLFSKGGAEGYQIIGVLPGVISNHAPGLGIAIKVSDGDARGRARQAISLTILDWLGVLTADEDNLLADYGNVPVKNWRKLEVGEVRPAFSLPERAELQA
jgi:L-asparaginase II